jgi:hypothetical protein
MKLPIWFGWCLSIHLTKGKYSSCLNPHIGICRKTPYLDRRNGYLIRFPEHWIFNVEWNLKQRRLRKKRWQSYKGIYIFRIGPVIKWPSISVHYTKGKYPYKKDNGERKLTLYLVPPFKFKTKAISYVWRINMQAETFTDLQNELREKYKKGNLMNESINQSMAEVNPIVPSSPVTPKEGQVKVFEQTEDQVGTESKETRIN